MVTVRNIALRRKALGWSQFDLARQAEMNPHRLANAESGRTPLTAEEIMTLDRLLPPLEEAIALLTR